MVQVNKMIINVPGEPDVGIPQAQFEIGPDLIFESGSEVIEFLTAQAQIWKNYLCGEPFTIIVCYEEGEEGFFKF